MNKVLKLSVHQLVDFLLRTGDIDTRVFNRSSMNEGSKIHASYQARQTDNYISEYPLSHLFVINEFQITLEGRADGIIKRKDGEYAIDEIKSTVMPLAEFRDENIDWHLGQAKCYAYMFAVDNNLDHIGVKLTYIRQGQEKDQLIDNYYFDTLELEQYVNDLLYDYLDFYNIIFRHMEKRNESIKSLSFPFSKYRKGQKELAKYCYSIAKNGGKFYVEAPTGIGKTMSTIFPYIKSMVDDEKSKIFYLTAKTSGKEAAYNAVNILKDKGLIINDIVITAKDKICFCKGKACNPEECPFAKNYYNKIQGIIRYTIMNYSTYDLNLIEQIAYENQVCPFEFELDLSLFSDVIICDYNYMFDPISYMKRYFDEDSSHFLALVDEAHNLVDRSKDMYSAAISYDKYLEAKKSVKSSKLAKLKKALTKMNKMFKDMLETYDDGDTIVDNFSDEQYKILNSFLTTCQDINKNDSKEMSKELLDFYLDLNRFLKICEFYSLRFITYIRKGGKSLCMHINCLDASRFLKLNMDRVKGTTIFSATMSPMDYYINVLGGLDETVPSLRLKSPFNRDNLELLIAPKISTKYKNRNQTYVEVARYIKAFIASKVGNYFIYCPSYEYLDNIYELINFDDVELYSQKRDMTDKEKTSFLENFVLSPEKTTIGLLVIGGAFGEGIDLVSDRLIGAVVIGIGMPKVNFISDKIAEYYKEQNKPGYEYAYINPGMNKVQQAVGRVIRSETDKGAVLLIDERYMSNNYKQLFREEWENYKVVLSPEEINETLNNFFGK